MTAPEFALTDTDPTRQAVDAIVIGTIAGDDGVELAPGCEDVDAAFDGELRAVLAGLRATGKADDVVRLATFGKIAAKVVVAAGLGKSGESSSNGTGGTDVDGIGGEQVRRASGAAARALSGGTNALTLLSRIDLAAAVEGTILGAYCFTEYRGTTGDTANHGEDRTAPLATMAVQAPRTGSPTEHRRKLTAATAIGLAVCAARDLVNTPPNDLFPATFAQRAATMGKGVGIDVEILDEKALTKGGYGGVLGVGSGSTRPPRLVRLRYTGPAPRKKVALVGKGITFDTGGISLKPPAGMDEMTHDMAGAAAMIAAVVLAAELRYPLEVTATVPMAENMPSGSAYRPGDVLRMYAGKTVEVLNTDAEGRLVLADGIARACEDGPDYLIEASTLTGAQTVALGKRTAGVMGSEPFRDRVTAAANGVGESAWAMPLPDELRADLDSRLADIANVTGHRFGGMLVAGTFLREFVADGVQWAHLDVAGPAFNNGKPWGYTAKGGTGVPVRTVAAVLADIAENG